MSSLLHRVRARVLAALPPRVRHTLRRSRDRVQRVEGRVRARLPAMLGGRLQPHSVHCRVLSEADLPELRGLRPSLGRAAPDGSQVSRARLGGEKSFCVGVFLQGRLVAYGFCIGKSDASQEPFERVLFQSAFVTPALRRRGIAQLLHAARLREAKARGARAAYAVVSRHNTASLAGLAAVGFEQVDPALDPARIDTHPDQLLVRRAITRD